MGFPEICDYFVLFSSSMSSLMVISITYFVPSFCILCLEIACRLLN